MDLVLVFTYLERICFESFSILDKMFKYGIKFVVEKRFYICSRKLQKINKSRLHIKLNEIKGRKRLNSHGSTLNLSLDNETKHCYD